MSKIISLGFRLAKVKEKWKVENPDIKKMRRRNVPLNQMEAKRLHFKLIEVSKRKSFFKDQKSQTLIVWLHGGAYCLGPFKEHLQKLSQLCDELGVDGVLPDYPKTPEYNYQDNLEFLLNFYHDFITGYDSFYFVGDSAGGGLCLSYSLLLKSKQLQLPKVVYTLSPWLDLTNSVDSSMKDRNDPFLAQSGLSIFASNYGDDSLRSPLVSPFFADFKDMPMPIYIYSGTNDILHASVEIFLERNPNVIGRVYSNMIHVWALMPMPEARSVMNEIICSMKADLLQSAAS